MGQITNEEGYGDKSVPGEGGVLPLHPPEIPPEPLPSVKATDKDGKAGSGSEIKVGNKVKKIPRSEKTKEAE